MPTRDKDNEGEKPSHKPTHRTKPDAIFTLTINTGEKQTHTINAKGEKTDNQNVEVNVNLPQNENPQELEANRIATRANVISNRSTYINAGLFVGTMILAIIAIWQYKSAQSAAETAQRTLDETKRFNKEVFKRQDSSNRAQAKSDSVKFIRDTTQFGLQKRVGEAQIKAFNESEKEFEIANNAYLQVGDVDTISSKNFVIISFKINNVGSQPAKIIKTRWIGTIWPQNISDYTSFYNAIEKKPFVKDNLYSVKGAPVPQEQGYNFSSDFVKAFKDGKEDFYLAGEIVYQNLTTDSFSTYYVIVEFSLRENKYYKVLDDKIIKGKK